MVVVVVVVVVVVSGGGEIREGRTVISSGELVFRDGDRENVRYLPPYGPMGFVTSYTRNKVWATVSEGRLELLFVLRRTPT